MLESFLSILLEPVTAILQPTASSCHPRAPLHFAFVPSGTFCTDCCAGAIGHDRSGLGLVDGVANDQRGERVLAANASLALVAHRPFDLRTIFQLNRRSISSESCANIIVENTGKMEERAGGGVASLSVGNALLSLFYSIFFRPRRRSPLIYTGFCALRVRSGRFYRYTRLTRRSHSTKLTGDSGLSHGLLDPKGLFL